MFINISRVDVKRMAVCLDFNKAGGLQFMGFQRGQYWVQSCSPCPSVTWKNRLSAPSAILLMILNWEEGGSPDPSRAHEQRQREPRSMGPVTRAAEDVTTPRHSSWLRERSSSCLLLTYTSCLQPPPAVSLVLYQSHGHTANTRPTMPSLSPHSSGSLGLSKEAALCQYYPQK